MQTASTAGGQCADWPCSTATPLSSCIFVAGKRERKGHGHCINNKGKKIKKENIFSLTGAPLEQAKYLGRVGNCESLMSRLKTTSLSV